MKKINYLIILFTLLFSICSASNRESIAILNFTSDSSESAYSAVIDNYLRTYLLETEKYNIIESSMLSRILEEQAFQQTGCVSSECAVEVGNIVGVEKMITGEIVKIEDQYVIAIKVIDVETAIIEQSEITSSNRSIMDLIKFDLKEITRKISRGSTASREEKVVDTESSKVSEVALSTNPRSDNSSTGDSKKLKIDTAPVEAKLFIDGNFISRGTNFFINNIKVGSHKISLETKSGTKRKNINITHQNTELYFDLEYLSIIKTLQDDKSRNIATPNRTVYQETGYNSKPIILGILFGVGGIVSGIFSAYYYDEADSRYNDYKSTTDSYEIQNSKEDYEDSFDVYVINRNISIASFACAAVTIPFWSN